MSKSFMDILAITPNIMNIRFFLWLLSISVILNTSCNKGLHTENDVSLNRKQYAQLAEYNFSDGMKEYVLERYPQAEVAFEKALALNPVNSTAFYMLSKIYFQKGKNTEAVNNINKALKLNTKNKYYYLQLAQIYEKQQDYAAAAATYRKLLEEVTGSEEVYYDLAVCYIFQHNLTEALKAYTKVEEIYGKSGELTKQKQQIYIKQNNLTLALKEGEVYLNEFPEDIDFKINQAEILYSNKKIDEALVFLEKVVVDNPENGQARLLLSEIYKSKGKTSASEEQLESIFNNPETELTTKLSIIEESLKAPSSTISKKNAIKYASLLVKNHPYDSKALIAAGDLYYSIGEDHIMALKEYTRAKELEKADFKLWNKIIQLDAELQQSDSMALHCEQALEVFPNQAILWLYSGTAYQMLKKSDLAIASLEQGKLLASGQAELVKEFNIRLGDSYNDVKDYNKSDKVFEEVLKQEQDNEYVLNNYSYYLSLRQEKLDNAKKMSEVLINKYPSNASYLDTYAWVLYRSGNYQEAVKYLELAVSNSTNGTILEHYGDALFHIGKKEEALIQWQKAKEAGSSSILLDRKIKNKEIYEN